MSVAGRRERLRGHTCSHLHVSTCPRVTIVQVWQIAENVYVDEEAGDDDADDDDDLEG